METTCWATTLTVVVLSVSGCAGLLGIEEGTLGDDGGLGGAGGISGSGASGAGGTSGIGGTSGTGGAAGGTSGTGGAMGGTSGTSGTGGATGGTGGAAGGTGGTSGTGGAAGGTGGTSGTGGAMGACVGTKGPTMVKVPQGFCIDSTEVTNAQYAAFLTAGVSTAGQDSRCGWNTTYTPSSGWPVTGKDGYPVVHVDWCDAYAYCKWAGKRLCGKIGGGSNSYEAHQYATESQWYAACSAGGTQAYPYGSTYDGKKCVGFDYDGKPGHQSSDVVRPAGTATCEGSYAGIYDLSGNIREWEDSCTSSTGKLDSCRLRGGGFGDPATNLACGPGSTSSRGDHDGFIGFRCCSG